MYTAYDDVFRTIVNDCSRLVLPMLNELFASEYNGNELIVKTENEIFLHKQDEEGLIDEYTRCTLMDMSKKVVRSLLGSKYPKVRKGVEEAMGGNILEYEAKTILNKGKKEGENLFAKLISSLFADGRPKDAELAAKDEEARKRFYREYGMIE